MRHQSNNFNKSYKDTKKDKNNIMRKCMLQSCRKLTQLKQFKH
jgi:hypothetical protein